MGPQISQMKLTSPPSVMDEPKIKTCVNEQAEDSSGIVYVKQSIQASISFHRCAHWRTLEWNAGKILYFRQNVNPYRGAEMSRMYSLCHCWQRRLEWKYRQIVQIKEPIRTQLIANIYLHAGLSLRFQVAGQIQQVGGESNG